MFKKEFQGGPYVEVFSAQGKDPVAQWKLTGASNIRKEFDRNVKSFVFVIDGAAATTKMQLPKDSTKNSLALTQRYLVLQLCVSKGQDVSLDLGVHDLNHCKRRLFFSTAHKETQTTPLHSKIPLSFIKRDVWLNLVLDLKALVSDTWRGQMYGSVESLCLSANCRLRRIFTMRAQPPDTTDDQELYGLTGTNSGDLEAIPKQCQLAPDIQQFTQVVDVKKIQHYEGKVQPADSTGKPPTGSSSEDLNLSGGSKKNSDAYHIAFGTKMRIPAKEVAANKNKAEHARLKSPAESMQSGVKPGGSGRVRSAEARPGVSRHERNNSAPGDTMIQTGSMRTSKTWTEGADAGKDGVPFVRPQPLGSAAGGGAVQPHPPSAGPIADRARRKPRVKSAGKERTPHTGFTDERVVQSQPSSRHNSVSGSGSSSAVKEKPELSQKGAKALPTVVANESEVADIMAAMQESAQRSWQKTSESESDGPSSQNEGDESISDVIDALRGTILSDGKSAPREYEDTDEEDEVELIEDKVYMFSSPPKSAPRHMTNNYMSSSITGPLQHKQRRTQSAKADTRAEEKRESEVASDLTSPSGSHLTSSQRDFWWDPRTNTEEEGTTNKHNPPLSTHSSAASLVADDAIVRESRRYPYPHAMGDHAVPAGYTGPLPGGAAVSRTPRAGAGHTPGTSQTRQSISRKSLREIPPDDVRLSQTQKPYNFAKYQMEDLSESFEAKMLQDLKEEAMQGSIEELENTPRAAQRSVAQRDRRLNYTDSCSEEEGDHTPQNTHRSQDYTNQPHNYQDEMNMASARLKQNEMLSQSNPREWGNVYSPPIVLTSDMNGSTSSHSQLSPNYLQPTGPLNHQHSPNHKDGVSPGENTDEEEELDLFYDPVLNCYFDPRTQKYYELKLDPYPEKT